MQKIIFLILFVCSMSFACSKFFMDDFCKEIDWWNTRTIKYSYFEIEPNWLRLIDNTYALNFVIRF